MMIKKQFTLYLENKPGVLSRITRRLAQSKVNIEGISVASASEVALVQVVVSNWTVTRKLLRSLNTSFTVQDVSLIPLENRPGALARVMGHLAKKGVNVNYVYATACSCKDGCSCYAVISAPNLEQVEDAWRDN